MGKVNSKYALIALSSIFALSMFGCTKTSDTSEMGRYIEEFYDAPEGIYDVRDLRVLADGTIGMLAYGENEIELYISEDECKSWNRKDINLPQGDSENDMLSVNNAILSKDGEIFISYCFYDYTEYEEGENLKEDALDDSAEESEDAVEDDKYYEPEYKYAFIDAEGSIHDISLDEISESAEEESEDDEMYYGGYYYYTFKFANNGDIVFSNDNGMIYQLDPASGEMKNEFVLDDSYINAFVTLGDSLLVLGDTSVKEYSLESGKELGNIEALESEVLYENNSKFYGISNIFSDDDKTIYYSNTTGLYKYELGSKEVEQIVEGTLSSIGDDNMYIRAFVVGKDNTFLACGQDYNSHEGGTSIIKFIYSADTPKTPENQITVYSLYEDYNIRQNIVLFQKANPDIYVKLETGISGEDAVTESDALRTLNTEIMAGKGPDIILLDGMSESYLEQGLLEDISDVIEEYTKNDLLFENIIDAYTDKDGKVSYEYDTDKIYKAVSDFVDSYNKMLKEGGDSNTNNILRSTKSMVNLTKANSNMLSSVGITIGTDNKLSVDETAFKKADMNTVKSLFHTTGGFGYQTSVQAGMIESYAKSEAEKANTYNKSGLYTYNYTTGEIYNTTT